MITLLNDQNSSVRWNAADTLGEIKSERAIEPLIALLNDQDSSVRWRAADILGEIKSERAIEPLIALLNDQDSGVRRTERCALGKLIDASHENKKIDFVNRVVETHFAIFDFYRRLRTIRHIPSDLLQ